MLNKNTRQMACFVLYINDLLHFTNKLFLDYFDVMKYMINCFSNFEPIHETDGLKKESLNCSWKKQAGIEQASKQAT